MNQKMCQENQILSSLSFLKELDINHKISQLEYPTWDDDNEEEGCKNVVKNIHINIYVPFFKNILLKWDERLVTTNVSSIFYEKIPKINKLFEYTRRISLSIFPKKESNFDKNIKDNKILSVKSKRNEYNKIVNMSQIQYENNDLVNLSKNLISNCTFDYTQFFSPHLFNFSSYTSSFYSFVKFSSPSCEKFIKTLGSSKKNSCVVAKCEENEKTWKNCNILSIPHIFVISIVPNNFEKNCQKLYGLELTNTNINELEKSYEYESLPSINLNLPISFFYPFSCEKEEE
ncbi:Hypothetical protein SRAE_1000035200 [Strongyloides ratti]|uniref:Uncharacterized protein n=1 Tax=Strongyloides ratti TaxID=34506 RepID=A0A090MU94_STRRB|nr:Hypothetical protein SRAE_1000035200 [Strongyloides ratti]CEF62078.1 Hypothetical protein SRAE_1000035200 [Strongyloides ratti]